MSGRLHAARVYFWDEYCRKKGWLQEDLSVDQMKEIRSQDGWRYPFPKFLQEMQPEVDSDERKNVSL